MPSVLLLLRGVAGACIASGALLGRVVPLMTGASPEMCCALDRLTIFCLGGHFALRWFRHIKKWWALVEKSLAKRIL